MHPTLTSHKVANGQLIITDVYFCTNRKTVVFSCEYVSLSLFVCACVLAVLIFNFKSIIISISLIIYILCAWITSMSFVRHCLIYFAVILVVVSGIEPLSVCIPVYVSIQTQLFSMLICVDVKHVKYTTRHLKKACCLKAEFPKTLLTPTSWRQCLY